MKSQQPYNCILVAGSVAYDEIMNFPSQFLDYFLPDKLHQINVSFVVDRLEKQLGGTATNISYNIKLATKKPVILLGAVGKDGDTFIKFCRAHRIDVRNVIRDKRLYTATGKVITDKRDNQIWGFYYGASIRGKDISLGQYKNKKCILVISSTHEKAFLNFQRQAIQLRIPYLYDPGMSLTWIKPRDLKAGVSHCRWLVGNDYEIARILQLLNTTANALAEEGIGVITTLGEKGVQYRDAKHFFVVPSYSIRQAIDPTGAGDAWRAGFLAGIVDEKPLLECLRQANAVASFAVEQYGTLNHHPSPRELAKRVQAIKL